MFNISAENYKHAVVHTVTVDNKQLFWVKMNDLQDGLGAKKISDLVSKEICGIYATKNPTKKQIRKYKHSEKELDKECNSNCKYAHSDLMARIVKNCSGEKITEVKKENRSFQI